MTLTDSIDKIIEIEGGYSNHPSDKGGPTMFGITEQVARAYGYLGDMQHLPRSTAVAIYLQRYWFAPKFNRVAELSPLIAEELMDTGINMGTGAASKFLQRALNTLNKRAAAYPDVTVDGTSGNITLFALKEFLKLRGKAGETVLYKMLNAQQSVRYMEISERNPSQEDFQFGWQNARVA